MSGLPWPYGDWNPDLEELRGIMAEAALREQLAAVPPGAEAIALLCHPESAGKVAPYAAIYGLELRIQEDLRPGEWRVLWEGETLDLDASGDDEDEAEPWKA